MTRKRGGYYNPPPSPRQRSTLPPSYEFYDQFTCPDYCYSTIWERLCIILSLVLITMSAFMLMASIIVYGELTTLYVDRSIGKAVLAPNHIIYLFGGSNTFNTNTSHERHLEELLTDSNAFGVASIVIMSLHFITASFGVFVINWTANRQITRIRYKFLENLLRQDISFYDTETNFSFATKMNDDLEKIKDGIGEKVVMFGYLVGSVLVCSTLSLCYGWELSLTGLTVIAVTIIVTALIARYQTKCSQEELSSYSGAGRCVEEVLGAIRTVVAFGGEAKEIDRYAAKLKPAEKCGRKRGMATALGSGINWLLTYSLNSIIFLYGTQLILNDSTKPIQEQTYQPGTLIIILCSIFIASQNITLCSPHMETFSAAKAAAITLYQLIERKSKIDALQKTGLKLDSIKGEICLNDVFFNYPSRPNTKVLNGLSVRIRAGESVGLVGESGCGKSTVLQLIQRLYDTDSGTIHIDGHDLRELNPNSLRSSIGVVGQEPVLFAGTVRDNIVIGQPDATDDDVIEAAKVAHAHGFITTLPEGYNTMITENGGSLSGGQKQRIAIARSIIRNPRILLLDEATSALDFKSEKIVQAALDKASKGRTTIAVTHRLSTIVNADRIIYIENGCVLEQGTHEELLAVKGKYWQLVQADMQRNCHVTPEGDAQGPIEDLREKSPIRKSSIRESRNHKRHSLDMRRSSYSSINSGTYRVGPDINIPIDKSDIESYDGDESDTQANITMWDLLILNKPELVWLVVGCIASIVVGASLPTFAVLLSRVFGMFSLTDREEIVSRSRLYSGLFLAVAGFCGIATFLQTHIFNMAGLKLTTRIRINLFTSYLRQEMSWFDQPTNSVGVLSARLSRDASSIQAASGVRLATILQSAATMFFGILIAMFFSWKMTLVSCLAVPVVIGAVYLEGVVSRVSRKREKKSMEDASRIASEAIMNIRTVQSMAIEDVILRKYQDALTATHSSHASGTRMRGLLYALGCCAPTVGYTLALYYGSQLIVKDKMPYQDCILVAEALIYGSWMLGQALSFTPNFSSAKMAAIRVLKLIDRKPTIISDDSSLKVNEQWEPDGDIKLESVDFSYRPDTKVLKDLTLNIEMNKTTAFVGHSGSGKSTIVQLLQRLYDVQAGNILIAGKSIKTDISLECLRSKLGIVQQEPILFDRTIEENIAYGDNTRTVQTDEIIEAAKRANIHSFIVSLPEGYATRLGSKGAQLSGGQKQRIAIARALVRNPKILLLDEATSALDTASEKIVQQALDEACKERTCIVIAHRLATIKNADHIYVLNKGELVEHGSHNELINKRGTYYDMFTSQAGS